MARKKKTERYVYVANNYRFFIDELSKVLERRVGGKWKTVGYFIQLEPMMRRIAQLETDDQIVRANIAEYIQILRAENEKIRALLKP
jgi:hypothetical protein